MPELPEIETIRRQLEPRLSEATVQSIKVFRRDIIHGNPDNHSLMVGTTIRTLTRHGKQLAFLADTGPCLSLRMGMTGKLDWVPLHNPATPERPKHTHIVWTLHRDSERSELRFIDPRRFGGVWTHPSPEALLEDHWGELGPDAATLTTASLRAACQRKRTPIKSLLLNQNAIAGIGNIYADEALFAAGIRPNRSASDLQSIEHKTLTAQIRSILKKATEAGGSTVRDYRTPAGDPGVYQTTHSVYGRAKKACLVCQHPLLGIQLGGRTTVYCSTCQR